MATCAASSCPMTTAEEMESEVGSPSVSADVPSSPGVAIVGQRSRAERDAEGLANAINLITPPRL